MQLIQQLEALGQSGSLKQFDSVSEMLIRNKINKSIMTEVKSYQKELFCLVEPDDDDDEK